MRKACRRGSPPAPSTVARFRNPGDRRGGSDGRTAGRRRAAQAACRLERDLRARDRALPRARTGARDGRLVLLRRLGPDQRVHGRVPDPEPRAGAGRGRRAVFVVRPGLQRSAREGRAPPRLAGRVEPLLADAPRAHRPDRDLHPDRAVGRRHLRQSGQRPLARRRALAGALPDRGTARRLRDRRRDPEQLRPLHRAGAVAGVLEHRDHRRARDRRAARALGRLEALHLRRVDPRGHLHPGLPADAVAPQPRPGRQPASCPDRLARPGRLAGVSHDGPGHARPRADQHQRGHRHVLRVAADQRQPRAERDLEGVPDLHAPAGDVLGRGRDGALPDARAARLTRRHGRVHRAGLERPPADRLPARAGRGRQRDARAADRAPPLSSAAPSTRSRRRSSRARLPRSVPGSSSTGRC